ncbi:phospholipase D-like domain-containing protein [Bradyrhizobium ontarionense]|uniref:Phospholipase D n=1 Tax=Bradyrhizobium ontarionense TaxID=2898149 RepID=A0ABY3RLZ8_9BRAD|nr:phospholipase D-like domain-containing protein [Bradyrhizobium sp. A19]UFZ07822.1 phospholipase D-like domain-containing protein [Bradyrhizobium sp. A19]
MPALAFSNNDIAVVAWTFDRRLDGCLGFAIHQIDVAANTDTVLPALARFAGQTADKLTTEQAPIQKFWWKDLFARRGRTYRYRIVPMGGVPGQPLTPLAGVAPLESNDVTLTPDRPPFQAYFNRGITATQALSHALNDHPSVPALAPHILDPADPIRIRLMGQLQEGLTSLLKRADDGGGTIHAALYELNDPNGLEKQLQHNPNSRIVILGNEQAPDSDDADAKNRAALKAAGVDVIDRILGKGSIPHNKFMVLTEKGKPTAVLSGSTNWTSTGLCTQTNNALVVESPELAERYLSYWTALKADVDAADGDKTKLQSQTLRDFAHANNESSITSPIDLGHGVTIEPMFSPNTKGKLGKNPTTPDDMGRVFELMRAAKHAVLFLAFDPGNNSILDVAGQLLKDKPDLFVRGALTSPVRATNFSAALHSGGHTDGADEGGDATDAAATPEVKVVGESGTPKKPGDKGSIDFRGVPAGAVKDAFGKWESELAKYGFAIIHNKIVVIDPFSDDCVVVTGSHNLGFRASHNNDENMLIIRGHRGLSEAYACHVLDLYDHYAWRWLLKAHPEIFGKPLQGDDTWQERYIKGNEEKSSELRFWLSAAAKGATGGESSGGAVAESSVTAPAKKKPAKSPASVSAPKPAPAEPAPAKTVAAKTPAKAGTTKAKTPTKPAKKASKKAAAAAKTSAGRKKTTKKKVAKKASKAAKKKTVAAKKAKAKTSKKVAKKAAKNTKRARKSAVKKRR